jgi:hypothetical protein
MLIIDRFEGEYAVVETSTGFVNIPRTELPPGALEGDVLELILDSKNAAARKERIDGMMDQLFKD